VLQCAFYVVDYGDGMEAGIGVPKQGLQRLEEFKKWRSEKSGKWSLTTDSTTRMVLLGMSVTMLPPEFPEGDKTEALRSFEHCMAALNSGLVGLDAPSQLIPHRAYPIASLPRTFDKLDFQGSAFLELELEPGTDAPLHVEVPSRTVRADQKGYTTSKADGGPVESIPACYVWGGIISLHIWEERRQYADKPEPATALVPPPANEVDRSRFFIVDTGDSLAAYLGHCKPGYQPLSAQAVAAARKALGLGEVPLSPSKQPAAATHIKSAGEPNGLDIDNMALDKMADSNDWVQRLGVAKHPNTSQITLGGLSVDDNEEVRLAVAQNPNTEAGILVTMAEQDADYIAAAARENPNYPFPLRTKAKAKRSRCRREHRNEVKERLDRLEREVDSLKCRQPERPRCSRCGKPMEG